MGTKKCSEKTFIYFFISRIENINPKNKIKEIKKEFV
jgi:hypothetical protein